MNPTVKQALHFFTLVDQKNTPDDQLQALYASGLVSDLLDANVLEINRDEFRRVCGLKPLIEAPKPIPQPFQFKVWKIIKLGVYKTPEEYRKALKKGGFRIGTYAGQILDKITIAKTVIEVDISEPFMVSDLGFTGNERYDEVCKRIVELGGELCPDEVGPATRVQYPDQPYGEWFRTAMKALAGSGGDLDVFYVARGRGGQWLDSHVGNPGALCGPGSWFVCVVPRK